MPNSLPSLPFPILCARKLQHSSLYLFVLEISFLKKGTTCTSEKQEPLWTIKKKSLTYFIVISIATGKAKLIFFNFASQHILSWESTICFCSQHATLLWLESVTVQSCWLAIHQHHKYNGPFLSAVCYSTVLLHNYVVHCSSVHYKTPPSAVSNADHYITYPQFPITAPTPKPVQPAYKSIRQ